MMLSISVVSFTSNFISNFCFSLISVKICQFNLSFQRTSTQICQFYFFSVLSFALSHSELYHFYSFADLDFICYSVSRSLRCKVRMFRSFFVVNIGVQCYILHSENFLLIIFSVPFHYQRCLCLDDKYLATLIINNEEGY